MKVEIEAKTAARTIKALLRALEIVEDQLKLQVKEINRLQFDNDHMAREVERLEAELKEYVELANRDHQRVLLASDHQGVVKEPESTPVTQSPSKPCPGCGATPWGQNADCPTCLIARNGL